MFGAWIESHKLDGRMNRIGLYATVEEAVDKLSGNEDRQRAAKAAFDIGHSDYSWVQADLRQRRVSRYVED